MKILLIDNYDSFTFNLYHYLSSLNTKVDVFRNDEITEKEIVQSSRRTTMQRKMLSRLRKPNITMKTKEFSGRNNQSMT